MVSVSAFTPAVKTIIINRTEFRCDRCGLQAIDNGHFHHRTPRRMGGSNREDLGLPSNGLLLHPRCHDFIESHRKIAAQLGFLVGYGTLPRNSPIMLWNGWHWLTDDGKSIKIDGVPPLVPEVQPTPDD